MVTIMLLIFSMNVSATWMELSGMNDHMGVNPDTGLSDEIKKFDKSGSQFQSRGSGIGDYLGFTVAAVTYFVDSFVLLGPTGDALQVALPGWVVVPVMTFVVRPIWTLGGLQLIRGVVIE
jgi:hypothetical protein